MGEAIYPDLCSSLHVKREADLTKPQCHFGGKLHIQRLHIEIFVHIAFSLRHVRVCTVMYMQAVGLVGVMTFDKISQMPE